MQDRGADARQPGPNVELLALQQQSRRVRRSNRFQLREPFPGDPMKVVRQAGAIVVRFDDDEPRLLLVTARRNPKTWIFPKGHIEDGETPAEAAVREAREEAASSDVRCAPSAASSSMSAISP